MNKHYDENLEENEIIEAGEFIEEYEECEETYEEEYEEEYEDDEFDEDGEYDDDNDEYSDEDDEPVETLGWDAITEAFEKIYPGQEDPKHYGVMIPWMFGGKDPLEGISIYDAGDYWHFVTYGLSELYEKESENLEYSGYGMEFTLKLKKGCYEDEEAEIRGLCGILQSIARITFQSGEIFDVFEYLYTGQTEGMDVEQKSKITGFITIPDEKAGSEILTPNGKVTFVEFIGATDAELTKIKNKEMTVRQLYDKLGSDLTDYKRDSVV
ncbi:MAG: suppressor of fused domain protein [Lachnospiraceae bacterium]|nr:suppressor of fused domain protein [Lachnospiraceae bacterium]